MRHFLVFFLVIIAWDAASQKVSGLVTDSAGFPLAYSTIEVIGRNITATANASGRFTLNLAQGKYIVSCQHIGYERAQQQLDVGTGDAQLNFILQQHQLVLSEVIVKKGEDPAYEIIRNVIRRRPAVKNELQSFTAQVYTKGIFRLRDHPKKFMGQKVEFEDGDTGKQKILFLSETVSRYAVQPPNKVKVEVLASKVSGQSDGFGLSAPAIISFYENNIQVGQNLSPRGFISPIADNALHFYKYKYEGAFFEEGRQISRISVIPKRKYEPAFSGYINIVEDEWRIHSLDLHLYKTNGLEVLDTLRVQQLYVPLGNNVWGVNNQVIYPSAKVFGFDAHGSFVNVYYDYDLTPSFAKGFFDNIILKYTDSSQKKSDDYWNQTRPIVLQQEEINDYVKKDSLENLRKSPAYLDSIDRERNKLSISEIFLSGMTFESQKKRSSITVAPLTEMLGYNTVEGFVINATAIFSKKLDSTRRSRKAFSIAPEIRYGFSKQHLNGNLTATYNFGRKYYNSLSFSGGSDVYQFNNAAPVGILGSTYAALFAGRNNLKIYEAFYGNFSFSKGLGRGLNVLARISYQDRKPLENTTFFTFRKKANEFTPNAPLPQFERNIERHQALITIIGIRWQPGSRYIEFPQQTVAINSKAPAFNFTYIHAAKGPFGSDVDYSKWIFNVSDALNLKLLGATRYRLDVGGFIKKAHVELPDYTHYRGNTSSLVAGSFMDRFQLVPHYYFSNTSSIYTYLLVEHHFNGLLTNKIPGLKQLKWQLVGGANTLYYTPSRFYAETFMGLENIFKVFRIDYIWGFEKDKPFNTGLRIGVKTSFLNNR